MQIFIRVSVISADFFLSPMDMRFSGKQDAILGIAANYGQMGLLCCFVGRTLYNMCLAMSIFLPIQLFNSTATRRRRSSLADDHRIEPRIMIITCGVAPAA